MATARNDSYSAASGGAVYAGIAAPPPPSPQPAWLGGSGSYSALPNSTFSQAGVGAATPLGPGNFAPSGTYTSVVLAWSGGVLNTTGIYYAGSFHAGTYLMIWGGGHQDYSGNEWYAYGPLESDAPAWVRVTEPTSPAPMNADRDASGNPVSRHTYDHLVYLPDTNEVISIGIGGKFSNGYSGTAIDIFNCNTGTWSQFGDMTGQNGVGTGISGDWNSGGGGYNPTTKKAYVSGVGNGSSLQCFDVVTRSMSATTLNQPSGAINAKGCVDPVNNLLIYPNSTGAPTAINLLTRPNAPAALTTSGTGPAGTQWCYEWDSVNNRAVVWDGTSAKMHFLTPPSTSPLTNAWVWTSATPSGTGPDTSANNGLFGRFRFVNKWGGGVLVMSSPHSPIRFYRY